MLRVSLIEIILTIIICFIGLENKHSLWQWKHPLKNCGSVCVNVEGHCVNGNTR